jgi:hypothetical protein
MKLGDRIRAYEALLRKKIGTREKFVLLLLFGKGVSYPLINEKNSATEQNSDLPEPGEQRS